MKHAFPIVLLGSMASAQPAVVTDLGAVLPPRSVTFEVTLQARELRWYRLELPVIADPESWLDIWTSAGPPPVLSNGDSMLALFNAEGARVSLDDDDGTGRYSALSHGTVSPARPSAGTSVPFNGRDGPLAAGVYYLALAAFQTNFGTTGWTANPLASASGNVILRLEAGCVLCPTPPGVSAGVSPSRNYRGRVAQISATVSPGLHPTSTSYAMTVNAGAIGGPAALELLDDGQGGDAIAGDAIYSRAVVIAPTTPTGPALLSFRVQDDLGRSATANASLTIGPDGEWNEQIHGGGDAGEMLESVQPVTRSGLLTSIAGSVSGQDADVFLIRISDPSAFVADTHLTAADSQLFLFDACTGMGVVASDDTPGAGTTARLSGARVSRPGFYLLAISGFDRDPLDTQGLPMWPNGVPPGEYPPVATAGTLGFWDRMGFGFDYVISLSGCEGVSVPINCRPPCRADFNGSGGVDPDDLGDFITCYFSTIPCAGADFDGSGGVDPDDLGDFITEYFSVGATCRLSRPRTSIFPGFQFAFGESAWYL